MRSPLLIASACVLALTAACGTTVPVTGTLSPPGMRPQGTPLGVNGQVGPGATQEGGTTGIPLPQNGRSTAGPGSATRATGASTPGQVLPSAAGSLPDTGFGWDKKFIYIGQSTVNDFDTAVGNLGVAVSAGCQACDGKAIADALNKEGGLFGRQIKMEFFDNHLSDLESNPNGVAEANCRHFTEDRPVFAVIALNAIDSDNYRACLTKKHVPIIAQSANPPTDEKVLAQYAPYLYNTLNPSWTKIQPLLLSRLKAQGWFSKWDTNAGQPSAVAPVKVGILHLADPASRRITAKLTTSISAMGYPVTSYELGSGGQSEIAAAVLRFRSDGVTHVLTFTTELLFFATAAESQGYRPRYGVQSNNGPALSLQSTNPKQANGAMGIGWAANGGPDGNDVDSAHQTFVTPGQKWCLKALADGGQTFNGTDGQQFPRTVGLMYCDLIRVAVLGAKAGGGLDALSLRRGVASLGNGFPTATGFASFLTSSQFAVTGIARDLAWHADCSCFQYGKASYRL